jgi:hypothetical protein
VVGHPVENGAELAVYRDVAALGSRSDGNPLDKTAKGVCCLMSLVWVVKRLGQAVELAIINFGNIRRNLGQRLGSTRKAFL